MGRQARLKQSRRLADRAAEQANQDPPWTAFTPAVGTDGSRTMSDGVHTWSIFKNSRFTVMVRDVQAASDSFPAVVHLSIRRNDRAPVWNWRDLQAIKNAFCGAECEAIEIYPAESRLVDTAGQYHLFVFADPTYRIPFGYEDRIVSESNAFHSIQEPFEAHVRPADLMPDAIMHQMMQEAQARKATP